MNISVFNLFATLQLDLARRLGACEGSMSLPRPLSSNYTGQLKAPSTLGHTCEKSTSLH